VPKTELLPVAEALARVLVDATPLRPEMVSLDDALGCVLTENLRSLRTQPPADVSAMDGYAVRGADVTQTPVTLQVIGEVAAGHPFAGTVGNSQAARIFTGGVLPAGSDTVVIQEHTTRHGNAVTVAKPTARGRNVRRKGIDFIEGEMLLVKGRHLTARDLMLAAAMNYAMLTVHRRPKIAVLATGDELVAPGEMARPGQIVHSNGFALRALARGEGADTLDLGVAADKVEAITANVRKAGVAACDVLVTTGGASVGEHDLVQKALAAEGLGQ
jgi:molybdopterin molybdotransferase